MTVRDNPFMPINVLNAEVSTPTISVKTFTIRRKQVTLAAFDRSPVGSIAAPLSTCEDTQHPIGGRYDAF